MKMHAHDIPVREGLRIEGLFVRVQRSIHDDAEVKRVWISVGEEFPDEPPPRPSLLRPRERAVRGPFSGPWSVDCGLY